MVTIWNIFWLDIYWVDLLHWLDMAALIAQISLAARERKVNKSRCRSLIWHQGYLSRGESWRCPPWIFRGVCTSCRGKYRRCVTSLMLWRQVRLPLWPREAQPLPQAAPAGTDQERGVPGGGGHRNNTDTDVLQFSRVDSEDQGAPRQEELQGCPLHLDTVPHWVIRHW